MSTLRVATLNIWNKSGPWPLRLRLIRRELEELAPALVGLQEVLRHAPEGAERLRPTPASCQATEIADGLDYAVSYSAASDWGQGLLFGNALLSRHPIQETRSFVLPGLESGESRSLLYALVASPFGPLPVFVTHLNWKFHHGSVRLRQVKFIVERIFELAPVSARALPPVLMGDFNADPDSDEIRYLRGLKVENDASVFFADAWVHGGDGSFGATFARDNAYAATAREPSRRIDYIFVRGPDQLLRGDPIETRVAFARGELAADGAMVWPSDHYGLVTDLFLAPRSP